MKIEFSQNQINNFSSLNKNTNPIYNSQLINDSFRKSNSTQKNSISFGKSFFDKLLERIDRKSCPNLDDIISNEEPPSQFAQEISSGIN